MFLILIAGASGCGKTEFSKMLSAVLEKNGYSVTHLRMDNYYKERKDTISIEEFSRVTNFDVPEALNIPVMAEDLKALSSGKTIAHPKYDFKTKQVSEYTTVEPADIVIVEGLHAFRLIPMVKGIDSVVKGMEYFSIYLQTSAYSKTLSHRINRDSTGERGVRSVEEISRRERSTVGPAFFSLVANYANRANVCLSNDSDSIDGLNVLAQQAYEEMNDKLPAAPGLMETADQTVAVFGK